MASRLDGDMRSWTGLIMRRDVFADGLELYVAISSSVSYGLAGIESAYFFLAVCLFILNGIYPDGWISRYSRKACGVDLHVLYISLTEVD